MRYINEALGGTIGGGLAWVGLREVFGLDLGLDALAALIGVSVAASVGTEALLPSND
ncbi:MAG: hypothetical protein AAB955_00585 [Patescibacteria group bacterium]